jgi:hypothetical protein
MAKVEEQDPSAFWDVFANRSSGQFPEGTPIELIVNSCNFQYGNPYPELDDEGIGVHPITGRDQGGLSFNTNLGADPEPKAMLPWLNFSLDRSYEDTVLTSDELKDKEAEQAAFAEQQSMYDPNSARYIGASGESPAGVSTISSGGSGGFLDIIKSPYVIIGGAALVAAFILFKK